MGVGLKLVALVLTAFFLFQAGANAQVTENELPGNALAGLTPGPDGRLYGLTYSGGTSNKGVLYSVGTDLSDVVTHVNFDGTANGAFPYDELIWDQATAKFYGATTSGGSGCCGTIFSYVPAANAVTVLKSDFSAGKPHGLAIVNGFIYGLVSGASEDSVFRMAPDGSGFTVIHTVAGQPQFLTAGLDGWLYGETLYGPDPCDLDARGCGTVFRMRPVLPGDTDIQFQVLHLFRYFSADPCPPSDPYCVPSSPRDFNNPVRLIFGSDGLIYGVTFNVIFRLDPSAPNPSSTIQFIWTGGSIVSVIEGADGLLYAADYGGGTNGAGQILKMNRDGTSVSVLHNFSYTEGVASGPFGRPYRSAGGVVYGTNEYANADGNRGGVFSVQAGPPAAPPSRLKLEGGNIYVGSPGQGIIFRSPGGTACYKLSIDNSGTLTMTPEVCP